MPDHEKHTLPEDTLPESKGGFRESTLALLPKVDAAALRHAGQLVHHLVLEAAPDLGPQPGSMTKREMSAAIADLLDVRDALSAIGRAVEASDLDASDARVSLLARDIAEALDKLVSGLPARSK